MIGKWILLVVIGFAGGLSVAGGVFAFISILEMIPRMTSRLHVGDKVYSMETCIFWGGLVGSTITVFDISLPGGSVLLAVFGLFAGIFIGCLAMALAETLKVIPVLVQRTKLGTGLPVIVAAMGFGKALGCFYQMFFRF
jgi:stage V sporulation protein AB